MLLAQIEAFLLGVRERKSVFSTHFADCRHQRAYDAGRALAQRFTTRRR